VEDQNPAETVSDSGLDPFILYTNPDPVLLAIYGYGSRLFMTLNKKSYTFVISFQFLLHVCLAYQETPSIEKKISEKSSEDWNKINKYIKISKFFLDFDQI